VFGNRGVLTPQQPVLGVPEKVAAPIMSAISKHRDSVFRKPVPVLLHSPMSQAFLLTAVLNSPMIYGSAFGSKGLPAKN
jgi:hypothetical protein